MDSVMLTRIIFGVLAVLVLGFLIQRRRTRVRQPVLRLPE